MSDWPWPWSLVGRRVRVTSAAMATSMVAAVAASLACPARVLAVPPSAATVATQPVSRGWRVTPDATLRIYLPAGALRVEVWERDSVHLGGTLGANASLFGGGASSHVKLGVEARDSRDGTLPHATLVVRVPSRARVWVKMIDGELSVRGTQNELEAYTIRGRVAVQDVAGITTVESIDAPLTLTNATGDVRIRGSRAAVTLDRIAALVSVSTVSGAVDVRRSAIEGRIETVGGTITVDGVKPGGRLGLQTHAGDVQLSLPADRVPLLDLSSYTGAVRRANMAAGSGTHGRIEARSFKGTITVRVAP